MVLTTPFLRELRRSLPSAWITLAVSESVANLVERCPYVNDIVPVPRLHGMNTLRRFARAVAVTRSALTGKMFERALHPRWDFDYAYGAFPVFLSGAAERIGFSESVNAEKAVMNRGFDGYLTTALRDPGAMHEREYPLELLRSMGITPQSADAELWLGEEDHVAAVSLLRDEGIAPGESFIACAPGAAFPRKRWPADRFIALCQAVPDPARIVVVGGEEERALAGRMAAALGSRIANATGRLTLRQVSALLSHARCVIGNDTGVMHLAAAVGTPGVVLSCHPATGDPFHRQGPARFGPVGAPSVVVQPAEACSPCVASCEAASAHCILGVSVDRAAGAVRKAMMSESPGER
jgi:heptosyltransferase-2